MTDHFINRSETRTKYTTIPNGYSNAGNLSWEAIGVLTYLLTKHPKWVVLKQDIINQTGAGERKVRRILKELTAAGYIHRKARHDGKKFTGWNTFVYDKPITERAFSRIQIKPLPYTKP